MSGSGSKTGFRQQKLETPNEFIVERIHIAKRYSLKLDKNLCKGCGICKVVCPKEAVEVRKVPKLSEEEKTRHAVIVVNEDKCIYCGICEAICPFSAIRLEVNGEHLVPVIKTASFPQITRDITIDTQKCEVGCSDCEKGCPLGIIRTTRVSALERAREIIRAKKDKNVKLRPLVEVRSDLCPGCRICEMICPQKAIKSQKIFNGSIIIDHEKCPKGCKACVDVCPFAQVLTIAEDGKICINEFNCTYCGVCKTVCPVEGALKIGLKYIRHSPVRSGAWNKTLERLTSTNELTEELRAKSGNKVRETVGKRFTRSVESSCP